MCDLENLKNEETMTSVGSQRHKKKEPYKGMVSNKIKRYVFYDVKCSCRDIRYDVQMKPVAGFFLRPGF